MFIDDSDNAKIFEGDEDPIRLIEIEKIRTQAREHGEDENILIEEFRRREKRDELMRQNANEEHLGW